MPARGAMLSVAESIYGLWVVRVYNAGLRDSRVVIAHAVIQNDVRGNAELILPVKTVRIQLDIDGRVSERLRKCRPVLQTRCFAPKSRAKLFSVAYV